MGKPVRNISCFLGYASPALKSRTFCFWGLVADRHLYSLDWSGLGSVWLTQCWSNSYIQSTNITKAMTGHLQVCLKLLPRLLRCLSLNPRGQKVICMLQLCRFTIDYRGIFLLFVLQQRLEYFLCSKELLFYPYSIQSSVKRWWSFFPNKWDSVDTSESQFSTHKDLAIATFLGTYYMWVWPLRNRGSNASISCDFCHLCV